MKKILHVIIYSIIISFIRNIYETILYNNHFVYNTLKNTIQTITLHL